MRHLNPKLRIVSIIKNVTKFNQKSKRRRFQMTKILVRKNSIHAEADQILSEHFFVIKIFVGGKFGDFLIWQLPPNKIKLLNRNNGRSQQNNQFCLIAACNKHKISPILLRFLCRFDCLNNYLNYVLSN